MRCNGRRKSVLYQPTHSSKSTPPSLAPAPFLSRLCLLPSKWSLTSFSRVEKSVESSSRCGSGDWPQDRRGSKKCEIELPPPDIVPVRTSPQFAGVLIFSAFHPFTRMLVHLVPKEIILKGPAAITVQSLGFGFPLPKSSGPLSSNSSDARKSTRFHTRFLRLGSLSNLSSLLSRVQTDSGRVYIPFTHNPTGQSLPPSYRSRLLRVIKLKVPLTGGSIRDAQLAPKPSS